MALPLPACCVAILSAYQGPPEGPIALHDSFRDDPDTLAQLSAPGRTLDWDDAPFERASTWTWTASGSCRSARRPRSTS